jgi:DNA-binding PadR family transcriptional regulator
MHTHFLKSNGVCNREAMGHHPGRGERHGHPLSNPEGSEHGFFAQAFAGRRGRTPESGFGNDGPNDPGRSFGPGFTRNFGRGFAGPRARMFDAGDIKLVILKLLSEQPSYGYQLIKTMEERLAGGYTPSAGIIYPTLTLLEEEGLATSVTENNKKIFSLTAEGSQALDASRARVDELFERLEETGRGFQRGRSPEIMKAFMNLRGAVGARVSRESVKPEQIRKIVEAINSAAKAIDEL